MEKEQKKLLDEKQKQEEETKKSEVVQEAPKEQAKVEEKPKEEEKSLIEIKGQQPSEAELRKIEELRKLKEMAKAKKDSAPVEVKGEELPKINAPSLPPVQLHRKGQFEMIPDFLKDKSLQRDMISLNERDLMQEALDKQAKN